MREFAVLMQGIPLVKLRNPKGNNREWKGDWSDGDDNWKVIPDAIKARCEMTFPAVLFF